MTSIKVMVLSKTGMVFGSEKAKRNKEREKVISKEAADAQSAYN